MQTDNQNYSVNIVEQEAIPVAALEHCATRLVFSNA
ncbi:hypothetical protein HCH_00717 [Hahella chejuensis KCTC 2396]|uniref:Uncharacterized protein n=1 Tax=Hahella chejuensis (strain KCTC 2396) TaxID=349521 RepID=Q2SP09_HAHCH|nr:hypothetical protein HCH_00717 [Hahella chejuensis KCTC 2396]